MIEVSGYTVITPEVNVVVGADATSATISWEYLCDYKENGCEYCKIRGVESSTIDLTPNTSCEEKITSGTIEWEGNEITYQIIQKPNRITYDKPRVEYSINKISGVTVSDNKVDFNTIISCGDAFEETVGVEYSSNTYVNSCDEPKNKSGITAVPLVFDCSNNSIGGSVSAYTTILGNDVMYIYNCEECIGVTCETTSTIENVVLTSLRIGNDDVNGIPCSGSSGVSCDITYDIVSIDEKCNETRANYYTTINDLIVPSCSGTSCCQRHYVPISVSGLNENNKQEIATINIPMEADTESKCFSGCGKFCSGVPDKIELLDNWKVVLYLDVYHYSAFTKDNISELLNVVIPIDAAGIFKPQFVITYYLNVTATTEDCEEHVHSGCSGSGYVYIDNNCPYKDYVINVVNTKAVDYNGCSGQTFHLGFYEIPYAYPIDDETYDQIEGWFEIEKYDYLDKDGVLHKDVHFNNVGEEDYPTIIFPYNVQRCREYPPNELP